MRKIAIALLTVVALVVLVASVGNPEPALACPGADIVDCAQATPPIGK